MTQPRTVRGREFLLALRELMEQHKVEAVVGWDTGGCWITFNDEAGFLKHSEPNHFELTVKELRKL